MNYRKYTRPQRKRPESYLTQKDQEEHAVYLCVVDTGQSRCERREMRDRFYKTFR